MANGDWSGRRGGGDRDTDARPGNAGDSPSYARIFDVRSESEFSNRPETSIQIREAGLQRQAEQAQEAAHNAALAAQSRVHIFPSVGKFIIPDENTWAAHAELVKDKAQNLAFNPEKFTFFDKIIADRLRNPALTNPSHPDYDRYENLRNNIAIIRNDIIGMYVNDGSFDPGDEKFIPHIASIADAIADGLQNDRWHRRPFTRSLSADVANVEGVGAREIYKYLLSVQTRPAGVLEGFRRRFNAMMGIPNRAWNLPKLEATPFSEAGLSAPPPEKKQCFTPEELAAACAADNNRLVELSETTAKTAASLRSVDTLSVSERETSVEEARKILRFLRNLQFADRDMEEWMGQGTPAEQVMKAEAVSRLVDIYSGELHKAARKQPEIMHNGLVEDASEAAGALAMGLSLHTINTLPDGHAGIARLDSLLDRMPEAWDRRSSQPVRRLLDTLESGLQHTTQTTVSDKSPADRLVEMSQRIRDKAMQLRSVHDMEAPAREESIELAREILRKLKNLKFSDRPVDELVQSGNAEDKAAFVQKIDEMVETYHNLLAEAAAVNPGILKDPRVTEANDAVGSFAHAVSLMAAKEIPNSMAAAQQISADVTQMPEEWKDLHNKTVDRLVKSMEGGLEQAVGDLAMQQQEQQKQDEEVAQETTETSLVQSDHAKRKRRRRKRSSGQSAGAQRKVDREIKADDRILNQGRFREPLPSEMPRAPSPVRQAPIGIRQEDLATVRELGGNLRDIGQQASALGTMNVANVGQEDKIVPDDKNFVQREQRDTKTTSRPGQRPTQRDRI